MPVGRGKQTAQQIFGDSPAFRERQEQDKANHLAIVLPLGKGKKTTKQKIGDSPALREREENDQKNNPDSPALG